MTRRLETTVKGGLALEQAHTRERMEEIGDELRDAMERAREAREKHDQAMLRQKRTWNTLDSLSRGSALYGDAYRAWDKAWGEMVGAERERILADRELHRIADEYRDLIGQHELLGRPDVYEARLEEAQEALR